MVKPRVGGAIYWRVRVGAMAADGIVCGGSVAIVRRMCWAIWVVNSQTSPRRRRFVDGGGWRSRRLRGGTGFAVAVLSEK